MSFTVGEGKLDTSGLSPEYVSSLQRLSDSIRARMSPKGELGIPELLDERRLEHGIPDGAFSMECLFDRILVFQIGDSASGKFGGDSGLIYMPETVQERAKRSTPRGILVGAGLQALDVMHSYQIQLGHIVRFIRLAPYEVVVDTIDGHEITCLVMKVGDLVGSEDLRDQLRGDELSIQPVTDTKGRTFHSYQHGTGTQTTRTDAKTPEDY